MLKIELHPIQGCRGVVRVVGSCRDEVCRLNRTPLTITMVGEDDVLENEEIFLIDRVLKAITVDCEHLGTDKQVTVAVPAEGFAKSGSLVNTVNKLELLKLADIVNGTAGDKQVPFPAIETMDLSEMQRVSEDLSGMFEEAVAISVVISDAPGVFTEPFLARFARGVAYLAPVKDKVVGKLAKVVTFNLVDQLGPSIKQIFFGDIPGSLGLEVIWFRVAELPLADVNLLVVVEFLQGASDEDDT